jgi:hypothetical protein
VIGDTRFGPPQVGLGKPCQQGAHRTSHGRF